jgi:hypothetical protein
MTTGFIFLTREKGRCEKPLDFPETSVILKSLVIKEEMINLTNSRPLYLSGIRNFFFITSTGFLGRFFIGGKRKS